MDLLQISQTIRRLRLSQNMTLEQLARKSSFTKGFLSQLENFRVTPSLNALNKIAEALGVTLVELFSGNGADPEYTFGRLDQGEEIIRNDNLRYGIRYFALAYKHISRTMEPFIVEYVPSTELREFMMHDTEEFFLVLEGEVDFFIGDTGNAKRMKSGDTLYMKANVPHMATLAKGKKRAKALIVYATK